VVHASAALTDNVDALGCIIGACRLGLEERCEHEPPRQIQDPAENEAVRGIAEGGAQVLGRNRLLTSDGRLRKDAALRCKPATAKVRNWS